MINFKCMWGGGVSKLSHLCTLDYADYNLNPPVDKQILTQ